VPELPELQAHAERLHRDWSGRTLDGFRALAFTALKTATPDPADAFGHQLGGVSRRGKYLLLHVPSAGADGLHFVVHLMQGGRLRPDDKQSAKVRGGLARWHFSDGSALLLTEAGKEKRAGVWVVAGDPTDQAPVAGLGPDADTIGVDELTERLGATRVRLHTFLRDQRSIAGVGRRLANEICHRARLSPFVSTAKLTTDEVERLHHAIGWCIDESLAAERDRDDMSASAERGGGVHHRVGEACDVCGDTVASVSYATYTVAYCPTCQTKGRRLADNATSKFLK
jgi:formamidopyrimidine-DNA glycosylase